MFKRIALITLAALSLLALPCHSQTDAKGGRVLVRYFEPATGDDVEHLQDLIGASLNYYIDHSAELVADRIHFFKSQKEMLRDMNDIVKSAIRIYDFKTLQDFKGFSEAVEKKITNTEGLDFNASPFASSSIDAATGKKMRYVFVQNELNELKLLANVEVGNFSNHNLLVNTGGEETILDAATRDSLNKLLQYNGDTLLPFLTPGYSKATIELLSTPDNSTVGGTGEDGYDVNREILALLKQNTQRLENMQGQIDQLRAEQIQLFEQRQNERNQEMQAQIDELRGMVIDLVKFNNGGATASGNGSVLLPGSGAGSVSNIPDQVALYFPKAQTSPDMAALFALNEMVDMLARNPQVRVIITGYADKTGDPRLNLELSRRRANEVKAVFLRAGLGEERLITRYLGDRDSQAENNNDRKVIVSFVR